MSDFEGLTLRQVLDLGNKIGGQHGAKQFLSGELILVERERKVSPGGSANGGITYASDLDTEAFLKDWTEFYKDVFGLTVDLSKAPLPAYRPGFHWGVAVLKGLTNQQVYNEFATKRPMWKDVENLDDAVPTNDRSATDKPYIIWCKDRVEADEERKNLSARQTAERGIKGMTFLERQLLGRWFYWKTGGADLDVRNATLCSGSRSSDGFVPSVRRYDVGTVLVFAHCYGPGSVDASLRVREVVS